MPTPGKELPALGDEVAGKYRIESILGQGGMGAVYSARNLLTGKRVAIKWLLPEHAQSASRERLLREARIACSIEHPNVVDIYDVGEHHGGLFLVMEYLRGQPLSDVLAERGRLDPEELIALLVPAMRGVHAAHQAGVIHRDLKPENIILSESDGEIVPKVVDFGVSKTVGASSVPHSSLTRTGALVGTPHYMALEQVDGSNLVDPRTDVYAFGVLVYRALTGYYPFDGSSLGEVILKIGTKNAPPMRTLRDDLPPELDQAVLRALSRLRELRYRDLEEFAQALEPFSPGVRFHRETGELRSRSSAGSSQRMITPDYGASRPLARTTPSSRALETPASPRNTDAEVRPPVQAFWVGAAAALLLLAGLTVWLFQRGEAPTAVSTPPAVPAVAGPVAPAAIAAPAPAATSPEAPEPGAALPTAPLPHAEVAPDAPAPDAPAPNAGTAEETLPAPADVAEPVRTPSLVPAEDTPHGPASRPSRRAAREARKGAELSVPSQRIPGERTKGLSSDDF